ncbi:60S ribosomal protein L24 [Tieghemiomyces parasiticus]|uniref:60S ribosomal protein L24 n=1 Tax=Tieghemiomyces parasiticus TaxID=78921 RepID=A0A9W8DJY1_9FUNG|nr:60S ribosomal protein L24 [Tieghemiomyces parasiticus]KAJ1923595.1 60S ribosomal protein L24 [Tieghemiomyces parasiticus]
MKLELCSFSGYKIYPGHGKTFVRSDSRTFRFLNNKAASFFLRKTNPRKVLWSVIYRRINRKGITEEASKKRSRRSVKHQRAIVGASLDTLKAQREQKPEVRAAIRQEAIEKAKASKKLNAEKKKAAKATQSKQTAENKVLKQTTRGSGNKGR